MDKLNKAIFDKILNETDLINLIEKEVDEILLDGKINLYDIPHIIFIIYSLIKHRNIYHDQLPTIFKMVLIHTLQKYNLEDVEHSKLDYMINKSIHLLFYNVNFNFLHKIYKFLCIF